MKKTTKQIIAILKAHSLKLILKGHTPTQTTKRYYVTLDADQPEIYEIK